MADERPAAITAATAPATAGTQDRGAVRTEPAEAVLAATAPTIEDALHDLRFQLQVNIAYHGAREALLGRLSKILTGVQTLLGTGAIASIAAEIGASAVTGFAVAATVAGVFQLVLDPAAGAREHRIFRGRYHDLLAELDESEPTTHSLRRCRASMHRIAASQPPSYRALHAIAYNLAVNATYPPDQAASYRFRVSPMQALLSNVLPFKAARFPGEDLSRTEPPREG